MSDLFEEKASDWDMNTLVMELSKAIGKALLANVELNDQMHVMDFGAGTGLIASHISPHVKQILAVDISQAMLDKLAAKEELAGKVETICQDITVEPLQRTFDVIVSAMAMHHVEDTDQLIRCFASHLQPGASIALADLDAEDGKFHPPEIEGVFHDGFDRDELKKGFEKNGFKEVKFMTAHTVEKENGSYPVFLLTARKA
jgi:putative AdoMet-dependent methyltransferase